MDTPGFGDSDNDDNNLINEMVDVLKNVVKTANGFVLLFNGMSERFDTKAQQMLREFEVTTFSRHTYISHVKISYGLPQKIVHGCYVAL